MLLDHELAGAGIAPDDVGGYAREEHTHLAVAAAVAAGRADAGWACSPPLAPSAWTSCRSPSEPYDLVADAAAIDDPILAPLWDLLGDAQFRSQVEALGGYSTSDMGRRIR